MKKRVLRKLNLHRETIRSLDSDLQHVHGGTADCQNNTRGSAACTGDCTVRERGCDSTRVVC